MSTIGALCARYLEDYPATAGTKRAALKRLQATSIGKVEAPGTAKDFIDYCRDRRKTVEASVVNLDIIHLRTVLSYAKAGWGMANVTPAPIIEAMPILKNRKLVGTSRRRIVMPTVEQSAAITAHLREHHSALFADISEFQDTSSRRISETARLMWGDLNATAKTILVRDMKHPRHKLGNDREVALPDEALAVILRQKRMTNEPDERIFKFIAGTFQKAFHKACAELGHDHLHVHDYRRGVVTRLLAAGRTVPEVMLVTGQETVGMVLTDYNAMQAADYHK